MTAKKKEYSTSTNKEKKNNTALVIDFFSPETDAWDNNFDLNQINDKPYFDLENGSLVEKPAVVQKGIKQWIKNNIMTKSKLSILLFKNLQKITTSNSDNKCPDILKMYEENYDSDWKKSWEITQKLFSEEKKINPNLMVVIIDDQKAINPKMNPLKECSFKSDISKPQEEVLNICETENITCLNLNSTFINYFNKTAETGHLKTDTHWNEQGQELVAQAIYDKLINEKIIK